MYIIYIIYILYIMYVCFSQDYFHLCVFPQHGCSSTPTYDVLYHGGTIATPANLAHASLSKHNHI